MYSCHWVLYIVGLTSHWVSSQSIFSGCPEGWLLSDNSCYNFVNDDPKVFEEADAFCWKTGAALVSINTEKEHSFIVDWLRKNDIVIQSLWYTSGYYAAGVLVWESDNTIHRGPTHWVQQPRLNEQGHRVAYVNGGVNYRDQYGWKNVTASIKANYICEIPKSSMYNVNILNREYGYGTSVYNPMELMKGPHILGQPESIVVLENTPAIHFECLSFGNPSPKTRWYVKNENNATEVKTSTSDRYTITGGRLTIQNPVDDDGGEYFCEIENDLGIILSEQAKLLTGYLGHFPNIQNAPLIVPAFKGTKLDCSPPAYSPEIRFEWYKAQPIYVFIWPTNPNMFVSNSGLMYVSEVQPTDAGKTYFCMVTLVGTETARLSNSQPPSRSSMGLYLGLSADSQTDNDYGPIIHTHAFPTPMLQGQTIRLECIAYGTPKLSYSWSREDGRQMVPGTRLSHLNRVLQIPNAPLEADGNYICTVTRSSGTSASKIITVTIEAKPYFPYDIGDLFPDVGMTVQWFCKAVARPKAFYSWYKNGKQIVSQTGVIEVKNNVLTIFNVEKSRDDGMYQCAAINQHGTTYSNGQLTVLEIKPNFIRYPIPLNTPAPLGGTLRIPCEVEAAPVPQISWLKDNSNLNLMAGDTSGRIGMTSRYTLVVKEVQYSDAGFYTCQATNEFGEAKNTTRVDIIDGIHITRPPMPTEVTVNRTAFLYCEAQYDPRVADLMYVWKFNGWTIDFKHSPEFVRGIHNNMPGLYIKDAQYRHTGQFECEAMTTMHSDSKSARLTVKGPPGSPAGIYADENFATTDSVLLVWSVGPDIQHGGFISGYDVEAETNYYPGQWKTVASDVLEHVVVNEATQQGKRTDQRVALIQNLVPNTSYRFRVRAINEYGRGHEASSPSLWIKIPQTVPKIAPRDVGGGGGKVGTLTITWTPLDISEHCGPNLGYFVYWKLPTDTKDWKRENVTEQDDIAEGMYTVSIGEDFYYLQYLVKVGAYNDEGLGPNSTDVLIYSAEGMPVSVPVLKDTIGLNGTSIIVQWDPVPDDREHMKGRVAGYRTYYYANLFGDSPFDGSEPDPVLNNIQFKDVYGQTDHAQLIGLFPYTEYFVHTQVFNTAGAGPKGEWRRGETANRILRNYPTHVTVFPHTKNSVRVQWRGVGVNFDEEVVQGYLLRVWKVQEDIRTATDTKVDKVQEAVVWGLQPQTVYVLRVLGYSKAGDGALSEAVYFTLEGGRVQIDPTTSRICYFDDHGATCDAPTVSVHVTAVITSLIVCLYHVVIGS